MRRFAFAEATRRGFTLMAAARTPAGGLLLIAGWLLYATDAARR